MADNPLEFKETCEGCGTQVTWRSDAEGSVEVPQDSIGRFDRHWKYPCSGCGQTITAFGGRRIGDGEL